MGMLRSLPSSVSTSTEKPVKACSYHKYIQNYTKPKYNLDFIKVMLEILSHVGLIENPITYSAWKPDQKKENVSGQSIWNIFLLVENVFFILPSQEKYVPCSTNHHFGK